ncbi:MAG: polymerase sigma-70 factor, subfamily [Blastocatellia bacterium]|jgi:RNA polymerase sigma-70 factor (ECF subfamily)|nr:polymerase sigma-70 factor, subfamily [Blastocatellia bacterium]
MMENQYENVKAALRWANQMEEAFQTQTNMLCRNAINSDGAQPFEEIFRLHHRRVYSLCLRMIGNSTEAEDLTQDVFMQVFRKLGSFRGESAFTTWLHRLTVNQVLMHFRKNHVRKEQLTEEGEMTSEIMFAQNRFNRSPVLDRLALDEAIVQLPHGYRTVFVLHDVEGLEHSEIASLLRCSIGTSKSQLHRARMRMRLLLKRRTGPR